MIDEGYIKFDSHWRQTGPLDNAEIESLNRWRRPLYDAGLIGHYEEHGIGFGNLSVRTAAQRQFIISGSQTGHLPDLGAEHYALVEDYDIDRNRVYSIGAREASSESMTHAAIYELDPEIGAVVHVHSEELWAGLKGSAATTDAEVAFGTPEMAQEFRRLFKETDFQKTGMAVMAGHDSGLVSTGSNLQEAAERILAIDAKFKR
ncbi:MAG: class II aldolase/adducin family protein [Gammaproteobacteria bacterium]|nr:MAG: class II aldolase/adducin family protein [Gammaproteobacteria bacterium]